MPVTINFGLLPLVDLVSVGFVARIGCRASMVLAHALAAAGLALLVGLWPSGRAGKTMES